MEEFKKVTFELITDDPCCIILKVKCKEPLDGEDLENSLKELLKALRSSTKAEEENH